VTELVQVEILIDNEDNHVSFSIDGVELQCIMGAISTTAVYFLLQGNLTLTVTPQMRVQKIFCELDKEAADYLVNLNKDLMKVE